MHPIAKLAMLQNGDAQFDEIIAFAGGLPQVKTARQRRIATLRADTPAPGLSVEAALQNAPAAAEGMICVPRAVEEAGK